jgi:2-keto-3-deoxy-L-fuconate dehydrogenase
MSAFKGRSIIVTGAASGLGKAWAEGFLSLGAEVLATDINSAGCY